MVEAREQTIDPDRLEVQKPPVANLKLVEDEGEAIEVVEFQKQINTLSKLENDFGLSQNGAALEVMADHLSQEEKASKYAEACLANEVYLSGMDQLEQADPKHLAVVDLMSTNDFSNGKGSALLETAEPNAPVFKAAFLGLSQDQQKSQEAIKAAYSSFYKKMTGVDPYLVKSQFEQAMYQVRNISPALSSASEQLIRDRVKLERELTNLSTVKFVKSNYDSILLPNPTGFYHADVALDLTETENDYISATEFQIQLEAISKKINELEQVARDVPSEPGYAKTEPRSPKKQPGIIKQVAELFKRDQK